MLHKRSHITMNGVCNDHNVQTKLSYFWTLIYTWTLVTNESNKQCRAVPNAEIITPNKNNCSYYLTRCKQNIVTVTWLHHKHHIYLFTFIILIMTKQQPIPH